MASVIVSPGKQIDGDDFWVASAATSTDERFANAIGQATGGFLGLEEVVNRYKEYQFEANGLTYRYIGDWELTTQGLVTGTVSAHGTYSQVILEQNGTLVATLTTDTPLAVDFGSESGVNLLGLGNVLNPVLDFVFGGNSEGPVANIHLLATPNLPDLAGIPDDLGVPGVEDEGTAGDDVIVGTAGDDDLSGLEGNDTLTGGGGNDSLYGNQGNDIIAGGAGDDMLHGGQNNDTLTGGEGSDLIYGGLGADAIRGNAGNDVIYGGNQSNDPTDDADTIYGGQGADTIYGNGGADLIHGGDGAGDLTDSGDIIYGGRGDDTIYGNAGNDTIYGQRAADHLFGDNGNDWLHGGQENDTVNGGAGSDMINGGLGNDILTGDAGADTFVFVPNQGADTVTDFDFVEGDRLDLQDQSYSLSATQSGFVSLALSEGGSIVLQGVTPTGFNDDFVV